MFNLPLTLTRLSGVHLWQHWPTVGLNMPRQEGTIFSFFLIFISHDNWQRKHHNPMILMKARFWYGHKQYTSTVLTRLSGTKWNSSFSYLWQVALALQQQSILTILCCQLLYMLNCHSNVISEEFCVWCVPETCLPIDLVLPKAMFNFTCVS